MTLNKPSASDSGQTSLPLTQELLVFPKIIQKFSKILTELVDTIHSQANYSR